MLSLIEVQCPHCGAKGQIMVPPVGSIIIGPCPQCKELVVVFCGQVLALEKQIMENGPLEERQEHLLSVLNDFLRDRVTKLMSDAEKGGESRMNDGFDAPEEAAEGPEADSENTTALPEGSITQTELDRFLEVDLKLLDNKAYFKSVFG